MLGVLIGGKINHRLLNRIIPSSCFEEKILNTISKIKHDTIIKYIGYNSNNLFYYTIFDLFRYTYVTEQGAAVAASLCTGGSLGAQAQARLPARR